MSWRPPPIAERLIPAWVHDCCETGPTLWERADALYDNWRRFAHCAGAEPGSPAEFAAAMECRGFEVDQLPGFRGRIRWGLRLR